MKRLIQAKKDFVRQFGEHDCGIACIAMILNYAGRGDEIAAFQHKMVMPGPQGLSLLELKAMALELGFKARPVRMDIGFLRTIASPCILHTANNEGGDHFQVCYGARKRKGSYEYLLADPARQVYHLQEADLVKEWKSSGALYFDGLKAGDNKTKVFLWLNLLRTFSFPKGLWVAVAGLNFLSMISGLALSWVLQRGINDSFAEKKQGLLLAVLLLLMIIGLFKGFFVYIRQRLLIAMSSAINEHLYFEQVERMISGNREGVSYQRSFKVNLEHIRKVHAGIMVSIATVVSDGAVVVLILTAVTYILPVSGLIIGVYMLLVFTMNIFQLPRLTFLYTHLNELSGSAERAVSLEIESPIAIRQPVNEQEKVAFYQQKYARYLSFSKSIAVSISQFSLLYESIGALLVVSVFASGLPGLKNAELAYSSFMAVVILSYFMTTLVPKICNSLVIVAEGIDAFIQHKSCCPN